MAIIENHPIKATVNLTLDYGKSDKIAERYSDEIMSQILHEDIADSNLAVFKTFTTLLNKTEDGEMYRSFKRNMELFGKKEIEQGNGRTKDGKPVLAWHYIQSFEGRVDAVTANEIGVKLAEKMFPGFPVQVSTHTDKENTHNHIIICAWANDGHKWHQWNKAYQAIREESDRLCDEYGLSVIEHTRKQKLVEWTDSEGQKHFYEPTDRKNEMLEKRERGEITTDEIGSYRNTQSFEDDKKKKDTLTETIKKDIDRLLPFATDYEHLLRMLRESGYKIKDKKKNGEWLSHITFTPPGAEETSRGKRDYTLSKDGYYTRENLTQIIAENMRERGITHGEDYIPPIQDPVIMGEYEYGEIDVTRLDENYRTQWSENGGLQIFQREEIEQDIIRDTKHKDTEIKVEFIDTSDLDRAIREQRENARSGRRRPNEEKRDRLVREIQENLDNLSFVEKNKVYTYQQANTIVSGLWKNYNACVLSLDETRKTVQNYNTILTMPGRIEFLENKIRQNAGNPEYMSSAEFKKDSQSLVTLKQAIVKYRLDTAEGTDKFIKAKEANERKVETLSGQLEDIRVSLSEYQKCMEVLRRIDRENGGVRSAVFHEYDMTLSPEKEQEAAERKERTQTAEKKPRKHERE